MFHSTKVLVTGASGFIGSHLCEALLAEGAVVTAMIHYTGRPGLGNLDHLPVERRDSLRVVAGNVEDGAFVREMVAGQEVVFHLAALIGIPYSYQAPISYVRTNVEGTANVLEACRAQGVRRIVHTSTSETYGSARFTPMNEEHPLQAQSPYAASKIGADKLVESYHRSFALPVTTLRPFNTYGPRQSARAVIPTIVSQALWSPEVRLGSLEPVRDLSYVEDTARAFLGIAACDAAVGRLVNVGTGQGTSVGELARRILALMDCGKPIVSERERVRPAGSEVVRLLCDARLATLLFGFRPTRSLDEGLRATIDFIRTHPELYRPGRYVV